MPSLEEIIDLTFPSERRMYCPLQALNREVKAAATVVGYVGLSTEWHSVCISMCGVYELTVGIQIRGSFRINCLWVSLQHSHNCHCMHELTEKTKHSPAYGVYVPQYPDWYWTIPGIRFVMTVIWAYSNINRVHCLAVPPILRTWVSQTTPKY